MQSAKSPAVEGYAAAMDKMHKAMSITYSNDTDVDFARAMIPHHQGAIDMAQVALQHAKDDQIRRMAQKVIDDQTKEIKELQGWLEKHDGATK